MEHYKLGLVAYVSETGSSDFEVITLGSGRCSALGSQYVSHPTQEAAEAALIAAQPVPAAVVRVRE